MTADGFTVDRNMVLLRDRADEELRKMLAEMKTWAGFTYESALLAMEQDPACGRDELFFMRNFLFDEKRRYRGVLIAHRYMNGNSVMGLGPKNDLRTSVVFGDVLEGMDRIPVPGMLTGSPIHYMYSFVQKYLMTCSEHDPDTVSCNIARSFNYYPSALREKHLGLLFGHFLPYTVISSVRAGDRPCRADTCIYLGNRDGPVRTYHLWSYQTTESGLDNTYLKFSGKRSGTAPEPGLHLLAPLTTYRYAPDVLGYSPYDFVSGWYLYSAEYTARLIRMMNGVPDSFTQVMGNDRESVKNYLHFPHLVRVEDLSARNFGE